MIMSGSRPGLYLCLCWKFISPAIMLGILLSFLLKMVFGTLEYEAWDASRGAVETRTWPAWTFLLIGGLISMSVLWIPLVAGLRSAKQIY